jgi:hypothetical protein
MATGTGASATDQAKEKAQQATDQVRGAAEQGAQQARVQLRDQVDQRSTQAGQQASTAADAIRQASSHLREQGNDAPARALDSAAGHVERAGGWLQQADGDQILHDVEDLARKNPLAVVAGGIALGFALSRLLKASSRDRYETRTSGGYGQIPRTTSPATVGTERFGSPSRLPGEDTYTGTGVGTGVGGGSGTGAVRGGEAQDIPGSPTPGLGSPGAPVPGTTRTEL